MKISATVGIYDGVHIGHLEILRKLKKQPGRKIAFLFFHNPVKGNQILTTFEERKQIIESMGVEVKGLDIRKFWKISALDFFKDYLLKKWKISSLVVGEDFAFGHRKQGTTSVLKKWGKKYAVRIFVVPLLKNGREKVSTSSIKKLLVKGNVEKAAQLLGRPYSVEGVKIHGRKIASTLGFPTINLKTKGNKIVPKGVFLGEVCADKTKRMALINSGSSPTFGIKNVFEFYVVGNLPEKFAKSRFFKVSFLKFIRKQRKFSSKESLTKRLQKDLEFANLKIH